MKNKIKRPYNYKKKVYLDDPKITEIHLTWWRFCDYVSRKFNKDTHELFGWEEMKLLEKWCKRYEPSIQIVRCDDAVHSSSSLFIVPHPDMGLSFVFVPQNTSINNQFFMYLRSNRMLREALDRLDYVYDKEIKEELQFSNSQA